jgi:hypothetical protein
LEIAAMPSQKKRIGPEIVDKTPTVWFMRLEEAVKKSDVRSALEATKRLQRLGYDVNLREQEAVTS